MNKTVDTNVHKYAHTYIHAQIIVIHIYIHTYIYILTYIQTYILCITEMKTENVLWQIWQIKSGMETHQGAAESLKEELQVAYIQTVTCIHT